MRYSDEQVCQPFGIHPFIVGIGTIPAGMKTDDITNTYYQFALQAHIEAMENLLDEGLAISRPQGVELDLNPLLRMDFAKRAEVMGKLVGDGIATPNEGRLEFNYGPLEGGDTVYMQQQDFPLDQVRLNRIAPPTPPAPTPEPTPEPAPADDSAAEEVKRLSGELFLMRAIEAARTEALTR
jgi:phage portal protein BeeE